MRDRIQLKARRNNASGGDLFSQPVQSFAHVLPARRPGNVFKLVDLSKCSIQAIHNKAIAIRHSRPRKLTSCPANSYSGANERFADAETRYAPHSECDA